MKAILAALCVFGASGAQAATIYSSQAGFDAAGVGAAITEDFNSVTEIRPSPSTFGIFTVTGDAIVATGDQPNTTGNVNRTGWLQFQAGTATVSFASAIQLFGFDVRAYEGDDGEVITFATDTGETGSFLLASNSTTSFVGFGFNTAARSITFAQTTGGADGSTWFGTDNWRAFSPGSATGAVPEPATWTMMIGGFGLVGSAMRRRKVAVSFA